MIFEKRLLTTCKFTSRCEKTLKKGSGKTPIPLFCQFSTEATCCRRGIDRFEAAMMRKSLIPCFLVVSLIAIVDSAFVGSFPRGFIGLNQHGSFVRKIIIGNPQQKVEEKVLTTTSPTITPKKRIQSKPVCNWKWVTVWLTGPNGYRRVMRYPKKTCTYTG